MKRMLNDTIVKNAKSQANGKPKKYTDDGGMYLLASKMGKYWRYNYKFAGEVESRKLTLFNIQQY